MNRFISTGKCRRCGGTFSKNAMTRHLKSCLASAPAAQGPKPSKGPIQTFHLVAEGRHASEYWLHLEVPAAATLEVIDGFLRHTWLECCGHLSAFRIQGTSYSSSPPADPFYEMPEQTMRKKLCDVLAPGLTFEHEYDFGTTTHLKLKVVAERQRAGGSMNIDVLARNDPPPIVCESCGQPATQVCSQCIWDSGAWLCEDCAKDHECGEEMLLPVVNSPRVGTCGYTEPSGRPEGM